MPTFWHCQHSNDFIRWSTNTNELKFVQKASKGKNKNHNFLKLDMLFGQEITLKNSGGHYYSSLGDRGDLGSTKTSWS